MVLQADLEVGQAPDQIFQKDLEILKKIAPYLVWQLRSFWGRIRCFPATCKPHMHAKCGTVVLQVVTLFFSAVMQFYTADAPFSTTFVLSRFI